MDVGTRDGPRDRAHLSTANPRDAGAMSGGAAGFGRSRRLLETLDRRLAPDGPRAWPTAVATQELSLDCVVMFAAVLATPQVAAWLGAPEVPLGAAAVFAALSLALFARRGLYRVSFGRVSLLDVSRSVVGGTTLAALVVAFVAGWVGGRDQAAPEIAGIWLVATAGVLTCRAGLQVAERRRLRQGTGATRTLILGAGTVGNLVARRLRERPEFGLQPVAFLDPTPLLDDADLPVIATGLQNPDDPLEFADALASGVREFDVGHVVVTFSLMNHQAELALMRRCQELGVGVSLVPRLFEALPDRTEVERIGSLPLISVRPANPNGWQFALKYALDPLLAAILLVLVSPFLLLAILGTALTLGRPVLFRQRRVGRDGRVFELIKLRTMRDEADDAGERVDFPQVSDFVVAPGGVEGQDRRTKFGRLLRRFSIDELPQLVNVMRGEMSLIGPRPERPLFSTAFAESVDRYSDRHRVKSGITGWAQVHGLRGRTSLGDRVEWDNYYIENWSPWLDLKIAFLTSLAVFRDRAE